MNLIGQPVELSHPSSHVAVALPSHREDSRVHLGPGAFGDHLSSLTVRATRLASEVEIFGFSEATMVGRSVQIALSPWRLTPWRLIVVPETVWWCWPDQPDDRTGCTRDDLLPGAGLNGTVEAETKPCVSIGRSQL